MELFNESCCVECSEKSSKHTGITLIDGSYICLNCFNKIPYFMQKYAKENYTYEDFKSTKNWLKTSHEGLTNLYHETVRYECIGVDSDHQLFVLENASASETPIFRAADIIHYEIKYHPQKIHQGLFGKSALGETTLFIEMSKPKFTYSTVLKSNIKVKATLDPTFGQKIFFLPQDASDVSLALSVARSHETPASSNPVFEDIFSAMKELCIDDLETTSYDDLVSSRNLFLKVFEINEDEDTPSYIEYKKNNIASINAAFEFLKDKVKS